MIQQGLYRCKAQMTLTTLSVQQSLLTRQWGGCLDEVPLKGGLRSDISKMAKEAPDFVPPQSHQLWIITMYDPKSLYENSRNQLKSHSTPGKLKVKNSPSKTGEKSHFKASTAHHD